MRDNSSQVNFSILNFDSENSPVTITKSVKGNGESEKFLFTNYPLLCLRGLNRAAVCVDAILLIAHKHKPPETVDLHAKLCQ